MEITYTSKIIFNKDLRAIDQFVFSFIPYLEKAQVNHVFISGYVVLFFGRDRSTEDVDLFVEDMPYEKFVSFWNSLSSEFECMSTQTSKAAYDNLTNGMALRFHKKGTFIPSIEFKPLKTALDRYSLEKRMEVNAIIKRFTSPHWSFKLPTNLNSVQTRTKRMPDFFINSSNSI